MESAHVTDAHEPVLGRVRVHITPFSVLREMVALDQGHIWHISIASHRLEIVLCQGTQRRGVEGGEPPIP